MNCVVPYLHPFQTDSFLKDLYEQAPQQAEMVLNDILHSPKYNIPDVECIDYRSKDAVIYIVDSKKAHEDFNRKLDLWDPLLLGHFHKEEGPIYPFANPADFENPSGKISCYKTIIAVDSIQLDPPFYDGPHFFHFLVQWANTRFPNPVNKINISSYFPSLIRSSTNLSQIG